MKTHAQRSDLVVVVLTTSFDARDIQLAYELGVNSFLTKPVNLSRFKDMVSAFHQFWIVHAQPAPPRLQVVERDQTAA